MHIQVINFGINVPHQDFVSGAEEVAPEFASLPGLISKHWLGDEESKVYGGGLYLGKQGTLRRLQIRRRICDGDGQ